MRLSYRKKIKNIVKLLIMIDMKKVILAFALVISLSTVQVSWASSAPKHRYQPATQQVDAKSPALDSDKKKNHQAEDDEGIEAYSDTTSVDTTAEADYSSDEQDASNRGSEFSLSRYDDPFDFLGSVFGKGVLFFVMFLVFVVSLLFIFAPLIAIILIIRYLNRRHKERMKLMEMAIEKGVDVPETYRPIDKQSNEYLVKRGLRNAFLGAGIFAMFTIWNAEFLAGIGALVLFYGLGQAVIGSLPTIKQWWNERSNARKNME